ncbi:hypothetical protein BC829DRAFT_3842 [Chytridium lagenaria]|nr:hypothetical protein BC829DRAFT_3842 [Chytridium lagenaria]
MRDNSCKVVKARVASTTSSASSEYSASPLQTITALQDDLGFTREYESPTKHFASTASSDSAETGSTLQDDSSSENDSSMEVDSLSSLKSQSAQPDLSFSPSSETPASPQSWAESDEIPETHSPVSNSTQSAPSFTSTLFDFAVRLSFSTVKAVTPSPIQNLVRSTASILSSSLRKVQSRLESPVTTLLPEIQPPPNDELPSEEDEGQKGVYLLCYNQVYTPTTSPTVSSEHLHIASAAEDADVNMPDDSEESPVTYQRQRDRCASMW